MTTEFDNTLDHDSSDETTDDDIEPDNAEFEYDFLRTLGALHSKNTKVHEGNYFKDNYIKGKAKTKEEKPMTLKDYERHIITERGGRFEDDHESQDNEEQITNNKSQITKFDDTSDDDDDDDGLLTSGLFKKTEKSSRELDRQKGILVDSKTSSEALDYLKGNKNSLENDNDQPLLDALKTAWNDPGMSKKDKWLVDYFVNRRFMEDENESIERAYNHVVIDEETFSEDEATLKKMEDFETKYNFRFEEPDEDFIKSYPRVLSDTVRNKNLKRKEKRDRRKKKKQEQKLKKQKELEEMKMTRENQIKEKLEKIKSVSGNERLYLQDEDLQTDFDPDAHDAKMSQWFGDDFYGGEDNEEYPEMTEEEQKYIGDMDTKYEEEHSEMDDKVEAKPGPSKKKDLYKLDFEDLVGDITCRFKYKAVVPNNFGLSTEQILQGDDKELNRWCSMKKIVKYDRTEEEEKRDSKHYNKRAQIESVQKSFASLFSVGNDKETERITEEERKRKKNQKKKLKRLEKNRLKALENEEKPENSNDNEHVHKKSQNAKSIKQKKKERKEALKQDHNTNSISTNDCDHSNNNVKSQISKEAEDIINVNTEKNDDNTNLKKRKRKKSHDGNDDAVNHKKKKNLHKNHKSENNSITPLTGISDLRLEAYGQNPKKAKNKLKYKKTL